MSNKLKYSLLTIYFIVWGSIILIGGIQLIKTLSIVIGWSVGGIFALGISPFLFWIIYDMIKEHYEHIEWMKIHKESKVKIRGIGGIK